MRSVVVLPVALSARGGGGGARCAGLSPGFGRHAASANRISASSAQAPATIASATIVPSICCSQT